MDASIGPTESASNSDQFPSEEDENATLNPPSSRILLNHLLNQPGGSHQASSEDDGPGRAHGFSNKKRGQRITEYIADKNLRVKSYYRRRQVPFKRVQELDVIYRTKSILIQHSPDTEECLFFGPEELEAEFLTEQGLRFSRLQYIIRNSKWEDMSVLNDPLGQTHNHGW